MPLIVDGTRESTLNIDDDILRLRPLGAGQEVGRSCIYLEFKGKKILLDMGIHPGLNGMDSLPFVDLIDPEEIDLLLISHFHLDHCGALPWFLQKTTFKAKCFMTPATKAIYRLLLADCIKVSNISADLMLYTESDLESTMDKIDTLNVHEEREINGIKFWCYHAGHVLGAAMFMIEIAGIKILYTGDFSRQEDRHLMSAEIPTIKPDVLIIESTYGTQLHESREERESRFTGIVYDTVLRGGRCLLPVFALGQAQELLLILDEFWDLHTELHHIPIYYASSLAKKCMSVYQTFTSAMNDRFRRQITTHNPFVFKHISNLKSINHFEDTGPCVVMATPGMLQNGLSRQLFEAWCVDHRNCCIIAGYCVEGTLAKQILTEPEEIVALSGQKLKRRCQVEYISFSAHADYRQTSEFVRAVKPAHVMLVHGEANQMLRLKAALELEYEDIPDPPKFYNPKNTISLELLFRGEKIAKVIGSLAMQPPADGIKLSGILVKKNFNYHLIAPTDLHKYTDMVTSKISQKLSVPFSGDFTQLNHAFSGVMVNQLSSNSLILFDEIKVSLNSDHNLVVLEWESSVSADMYADAIITMLLKQSITKDDIETLQQTIDERKVSKMPKTVSSQAKELIFTNLLIESICEMFSLNEEQLQLDVSVDDNKILKFNLPSNDEKESTIIIDMTKRQVMECERNSVRNMLTQLLNASQDIGI
ncbi:hypothetical protein RDWZM_000139 [Blomia tropicalis]|uniref:Cleavage and polyadenylation specificity factor subunit 3 n=1 Tax=Blomia tropicalis TaxID=40697 RepID=A0A9Q0M9U4_BLOTA|nr:hypothetical protein RDWZM_000139 [Blomia tropicalis]